MLKIKVFLNSKEIDTVFYSNDYLKGFKNLNELKQDVKRSLVNHDGYNQNITLKVSA